MSDRRGKKRPKSYYIKCAGGGKKVKRVNDLAAGMKGFLVTCNKYERETVREMYNILNEYADQLYGPEVKSKEVDSDENDSDDDDMEKAIAKEKSAMKEAENKERRFQNTDTKSKNSIFIRTTVDDPCELAHKIFTDIIEKQVQKARYALRMLPISVTCKANMNNIKEAAEPILKAHFETEFGVGVKYTSVCKIRNNQSVSRTAILPTLGKIIQELNPLHRLCHDEPDLVIIIEVIRNVCCMSVVRDYFNFKKYNFHEVIGKKDDVDNSSTNRSGTDKDTEDTKNEGSTVVKHVEEPSVTKDAADDSEVKTKSADEDNEPMQEEVSETKVNVDSGVANIADPDETAPKGAVSSGSTLSVNSSAKTDTDLADNTCVKEPETGAVIEAKENTESEKDVKENIENETEVKENNGSEKEAKENIESEESANSKVECEKEALVDKNDS